ncbi:GNAT family N-acetyltransferase [Methylobacterium goesingense]|uniref:Aminoglycoside 6'-N-acetyltransferase n=1 Tax=Methylobacterium goesingense TaxID=243690 RepID=A0ABV2L3I7_9HYPH|nr:GNAT family N-acetyltransferase [Methylobacterium goesingense]
MSDSYLIRRVREDDLPLLACWRRQDHVCRWWGSPDVEPEAEKLREGRVAMWIAADTERPLAFIQDYAVANWSPHHFDYLPNGSRGMDVYIGEEGALGRGHGARIVRQHVDCLFSLSVPAVGIDPHPDNERARKSFARAGFVVSGEPLVTRWGQAILMHRFA